MKKLLTILVAPLLLAGCGPGASPDSGSSSDSSGVVIVGQKFTEADVMSQLYKQLLEDAGFEASVKNLGARDVYLQPLIDGDVQVSTDYLASMTEALNRKANGDDAPKVASPDADATLAELEKLASEYGLTALKPAEAQDANAFAVTKDFAAKHSLKTLSDLGEAGVPVKLGAASDCPQRPDCKLGLEQTYKIEITAVEPTGFGSEATKKDLAEGRTQLGLVGETDASLDDLGLVILEDDQDLQNAENLLPIVNSAWLADHEEARDALEKLSHVLTTEDLTGLIGKVLEERQKPEDVAKEYLQEKGLV